MKKLNISILLPILTALIFFVAVPMCGNTNGATLEGVTLTGVTVNEIAPCNYWPLERDLADRTGNILGTVAHAGTNRTYVDPVTGLVTAIGANLPRFEEVGGYRALLIEPAGTNLVTYSHEFRAAISDWTNNNSTVTDDDTTGPDGTAAADKLVLDATAAVYHYTVLSIAEGSFTDNASVTFSFYAKPEELTWVCIKLRNKDNLVNYAYFNLATGGVGTETVDSYGSESAGNGFYRYWITHDIESGATNPLFYIYLAEADGDITIDGDSTSGIYIWGAQVEESPVPTSYIATSGSAVTRATESGEPHFTLPTGLFDDKGTAIVWWRPGWDYTDMPDLINSGIISSNEGLSLIYNRRTGGAFRFQSFDGSTTTIKGSLFTVGTWYKLAAKWGYLIGGVKKFRVGVDTGSGISWGAEQTFDGSYTLGASLRLAYGLFGPLWLRDLRLYDRIPSDSEINSMGSP